MFLTLSYFVHYNFLTVNRYCSCAQLLVFKCFKTFRRNLFCDCLPSEQSRADSAVFCVTVMMTLPTE